MNATTTRTAAEYRQMAAESRQRSIDLTYDADGFYRDDAFVSINAAKTMASRYEAAAQFVEEGETVTERALFNLDGTVASTHHAEGQWGEYWVLNDEAAAAFGKRFFTPSAARNAVARNRAKGFTEGTVRVAGYLDRAELTQPSVAALKAGDFEIVAADDYAGLDVYPWITA